MRLPWPKRLSVILVPEGGARTYNFQLRTIVLLLLIGAAFVLFVTSLGSMFSFGQLITTSAENSRLRRQVSTLEEDLIKLENVEAELASSEHLRRQVLVLMGAMGHEIDSIHAAPTSIAMAASGSDVMRVRQANFLRSIPSTWPARGPVTRGFIRANQGAALFHPGVDIAAATGTPVRSSASGTVAFAGADPEYGNLVIIAHGLGLETRYAHNDRLAVAAGQRVTRGQLIAAVGSTGKSSAPHLHFEVLKHGVPVDPRKYLD